MKTFLIKIFGLLFFLRVRFYPVINKIILKTRGAVIGKNIQIPGKVFWIISKGGKINIGDDFYFSSGDAVNPIASNMHGSIYLDKRAKLHIGNNVGMSSTRIWVHNSVIVGNNVKIGACVLITDTDVHPIDSIARRFSNIGTKSAPVVIEDDVWIGAHSIILKGVTIGARSIIGAGSVVTRSVPADCVAAGNPCRVIKFLDNK